MQPNGRLNTVADPPETPSPSDSNASYWLARTTWALGEGYAAFKNQDPAFASFLRTRLDLSVTALRTEVLNKYGQHLQIDGRSNPAWLVVNGADASAEAVHGPGCVRRGRRHRVRAHGAGSVRGGHRCTLRR